jgi:hypothetical protein
LDHDPRWERFERKFFVSPEKTDFARGLLSHICLRDSKYPRGRINSLYFDTPDLDYFQKSGDGNYEREKIRIRWYDNPSNQSVLSQVEGQGMVPVYLELKSKKGFASRKQRRKIFVPAERFNRIRADSALRSAPAFAKPAMAGEGRSQSMSNTIINRNIISRTLSEFGYFSQDPLLPVIIITYERFRFTEILTGTRLSFDWRICSELSAPWLGYSEASLMLEGGIIEIKGPSMEIPRSLRPLSSLGIDWTRFSKYAYCLESQMEKPGSIGRFWPSGRIELL